MEGKLGEHLVDDVRHALLLEVSRILMVQQKPQRRHQLAAVMGEALRLPATGKAGDFTRPVAFPAVVQVKAERGLLPEQGRDVDIVALRAQFQGEAEQLRHRLGATEALEHQVASQRRREDVGARLL
ncbi:hypothetical protein D3C79_876570 [compost metagenome]